MQEVKPSRALVIPVDGTTETGHAFQWCIKNLYREGDTLHIIHVVPYDASEADGVPVWYGTFEGPVFFAGDNGTVDKGLKLVKDVIEPLLEGSQIPHKVHVLQHPTSTSGVAGAIADKAQELAAHAIVLAHHKKSALSTWFLGSVCGELINSGIEIPLVIVR